MRAISVVEIGRALSSKFEMLLLIVTDWHVSRPDGGRRVSLQIPHAVEVQEAGWMIVMHTCEREHLRPEELDMRTGRV